MGLFGSKKDYAKLISDARELLDYVHDIFPNDKGDIIPMDTLDANITKDPLYQKAKHLGLFYQVGNGKSLKIANCSMDRLCMQHGNLSNAMQSKAKREKALERAKADVDTANTELDVEYKTLATFLG